jgi:hypothetical protein
VFSVAVNVGCDDGCATGERLERGQTEWFSERERKECVDLAEECRHIAHMPMEACDMSDVQSSSKALEPSPFWSVACDLQPGIDPFPTGRCDGFDCDRYALDGHEA